MITRKKFELLILSISIILAASIFIIVARLAIPAEDAAILYIYSENLANHGTISFSLDSPPAEGATDFLWMLLIAGLNKIGIESFYGALLISFVSLLALLFIFQKTRNFFWKNSNSYLVSILGLLGIVGTKYINATYQGFSPLYFSGFIVFTISSLFLQEKLFPILCLITCLIRPDGLFYLFPLLTIFLIKKSNNNRKTRLLSLFKFFFLPGVLYFIWRLTYFQEWLPLPFYVKESLDKELLSLSTGERFLILSSFIFICTLIITFWHRYSTSGQKSIRNLDIFLFTCLLSAFSAFVCYTRFGLSQNISFRFQFPIYIIILFAFLVYVRDFKLKLLAVAITLLLILKPTIKSYQESLIIIPSSNVYPLAQSLKQLGVGKMAVTEAGRLPYYSGWFAIDMWGLNTKEFAKNLIQPEDIGNYDPDLIVIHAATKTDYSFFCNPKLKVKKSRSWVNMTHNIFLGIPKDEYLLFFVPFNNQKKKRYDAFFVKKESNLTSDLVTLLKDSHGVGPLPIDQPNLTQSCQKYKKFDKFLP